MRRNLDSIQNELYRTGISLARDGTDESSRCYFAALFDTVLLRVILKMEAVCPFEMLEQM